MLLATRNLIIVLLLISTLGLKAQETTSFWEPVKGPYSGQLWAMFVSSSGTYYAGTAFGSVFRKKKDEDIWKLVAQSPDKQTILSFGEHEGAIIVGDAYGWIASSSDDGDTWITENQGIAGGGQQVRSLKNTQIGFLAGTGTGIYKRTPIEGVTGYEWVSTSFETGKGGNFVFSLAEDDQGNLWVGSAIGIYKSQDGGQTWSEAGLNIALTAVFGLAIKEGNVYAGTDEGLFVHYQTSEDGVWNQLVPELTKGNQVRSVAVINSKLFVSVTGNRTFFSENDTDWVKLHYFNNQESASVEDEKVVDARAGFCQDGELLVTGTFDGVWVNLLNDLTRSNSKIGIPEDINFLTSTQSKLFAVANARTLYESNSADSDLTWLSTFALRGEGQIRCYTEKVDGSKYINLSGAGTGAPLLGYKLDASSTGFDAAPFPTEVKTINQIFITSKGAVLIAANSGIYSFNVLTEEIKRLSKVTLVGKEILSLSEDAVGNIYAATPSGFYVSFDDALTWSVSKLVAEKARINCILTTGDKKGYAATSNGLYYFNDLESEPVKVGEFNEASSVVKDQRGHLYVISAGSAYYAHDENAYWELLNEGLKNYTLSRLQVVGNYVYVSSNGGLFRHQYAGYASVSLSGLGTYLYNGQERVATATVVPENLNYEITYNDDTTVPVNAGKYNVKVKVIDNVYVGEAVGEIIIDGIPASISITPTPGYIYDGTQRPATASTEPPGLEVNFLYNGSTEIPVAAGDYEVTATIGTANYVGHAESKIQIEKAQQAISFSELPDKLVTDNYFIPSASSSKNLPVEFNIGEGPAFIIGDTVVLNGGSGEVVVNAVQPGNENYYPAHTVTRKFFVWVDVILSVEDNLQKSLVVYPIPANDKITIRSEINRIRSITITDVYGRTLAKELFSLPTQQYDFNLSDHPSGTLLLTVITERNERITRQIQFLK
jgi:photosystem II stability/assembly factor-like uncharacterized protein